MDQLDELYREVILDHFQSPRHRGKLADANVVAEGKNPLCGDELTLYVRLDGDKVADVMWDGRGCSISQAASSMLTDVVRGKTITEAEAMIAAVKQMMRTGILQPVYAAPASNQPHSGVEGEAPPALPVEGATRLPADGVVAGAPEINLGDVEVLSGVSKFPVRVKCALLAWTTLAEGIKNHGRERHTEFSF